MYGAGDIMGVLGVVSFTGAVLFCIIGCSHKSLNGFVGLSGIMAVAGVILVICGATASVPGCTAPVGSKVQWRKTSTMIIGEGGTITHHYSYLDLNNGQFCLVKDRDLYDMGIGYTTKQEYTGKVTTQP